MNKTKTLNILIADDHDIVRFGVRALAEGAGWNVCGEAATGDAAVALAQKHRPAVVVMDIGMPGLNGLLATRQIRTALPETEVLIVSMHDSEQKIREAWDAGARGYLMKFDVHQHLVAAVKALAGHQTYFTASVSAWLMNPAPGDQAGRDAAGGLTVREAEVLQQVAEGKCSKEIADKLGISPRTVEVHRSHIMEKTSSRSVGDLVRYAIRNGIAEA